MTSYHLTRTRECDISYSGHAICGEIGITTNNPDMVTCRRCKRSARFKAEYEFIHGPHDKENQT
jgi:hypothetical protein